MVNFRARPEHRIFIHKLGLYGIFKLCLFEYLGIDPMYNNVSGGTASGIGDANPY